MTFNEFFEGAEKRLSVNTYFDLLSISEEKWTDYLIKTECTVLSIIKNDYFKFFLLSESSFIVGKNFMMIKTCGRTRPLVILENLKNIDLNSIFYSHYDFMKPELQLYPHYSTIREHNYLSEFVGNVIPYNKLKKWFYFEYSKNKNQCDISNFYELICKDFEWVSHKEILCLMKLVFPQSIISDKCFDPCGYSLNLLQDNVYVTIHVTPQSSCKYLSMESNYSDSIKLFKQVVEVIKSTDYDIHFLENGIVDRLDSMR